MLLWLLVLGLVDCCVARGAVFGSRGQLHHKLQASHPAFLQSSTSSCDDARTEVSAHDCYRMLAAFRRNDLSGNATANTLRTLEVLASLECDPQRGRCDFDSYVTALENYEAACVNDSYGWATTRTDALFVAGICRELTARNPDSDMCHLKVLRAYLYEEVGREDDFEQELCSVSPASCIATVQEAFTDELESDVCVTDRHRIECTKAQTGRLCSVHRREQYDTYCLTTCPSALGDLLRDSECPGFRATANCFLDSPEGCPVHDQTGQLCYGTDPNATVDLFTSQLEQVCEVNRTARSASCSENCRTFATSRRTDLGCCFSTIQRECTGEFLPWDIIEESCEQLTLSDDELPLPELPQLCSFVAAVTIAPTLAATACCGFPWF